MRRPDLDVIAEAEQSAQRRVERVLSGPEVQVDQLADAIERRLGAPA